MGSVCVREQGGRARDLEARKRNIFTMASGSAQDVEQEVRTRVNDLLISSGEKDRLREALRESLIKNGWRDAMKKHCKEVIEQKGLEHITIEDLVKEVTPHGRATVPEGCKTEVLEQVRQFLDKHDVAL